MHSLSALALSIASAHALSPNILKRQSLADELSDNADELCQPKNSTGSPDFSAPCNVIIALQTQCIYGPQAADYVALSKDDDRWNDAADWNTQPPETQRDCLCQSQFFDQLSGCQKCYEANDSNFFEYAAAFVGMERGFASYVEEDYCAASATPSVGWGEFVFSAAVAASPTGSASSPASTVTEVTATETDVSLYFTGSVPGSSVWSISQPTPVSGNVTYTSLNTESGMIKPTAVASAGDDEREENSNGDSNESTSSGADGAEETGAPSDESAGARVSLANAVAAGVLSFAAMIFAL